MEILYTTQEIVSIDSNFGHLRWETYDPDANKSKSNKGRKAQAKPKKKRKVQGDGSSFNSSIQFTILGSCIRRTADVFDDKKMKKDYISIEDLEDGTEKIVKYYKPKLYRNGRVCVPGALLEDISDAVEPLDILCEYLCDVMNLSVERSYMENTMKNYKFRLRSHNIDMRAMQKHFVSRHEGVKLVRFEDIKKFLTAPAFDGCDVNPSDSGWNAAIKNMIEGDIESIDYEVMEEYLKQSQKSKNMYVRMDDLQAEIEKYKPHKVYEKIVRFVRRAKNQYGYEIGDRVIRKAIRVYMSSYFTTLQKRLTTSKNNDISGFRYNPERTQVFIIRIKPIPVHDAFGLVGIPALPVHQIHPAVPPRTSQRDETKDAKSSNITIKLYPGGKINIHNAKSHAEAEYVYYWLNDLFINNDDLIFDPNINKDDLDPDDEWSYTLTDEDEDD
jgi:hypothetical protein